mgnify:FL=1
MLTRIFRAAVFSAMLAVPALAQSSTYVFERGFPANEEVIQTAREATVLRRAVEAYKYFYPTVATEAVMQQFEPFGARANEVGIIMPQDPEQQFSVANQDTPYLIAVFDLKEGGPMVIEVPEGPYIGLIDDHHMEWFGDMGTIGAGKGKGEKNLLIPPGYEGDIPQGYAPLFSKTWKSVLAMRIVVPNGDYDEAVNLARKLKVYPLEKASGFSNYEIVDVKGKPAPLPMLKWEKSMDYWRQLHAVIGYETSQERHRFMSGMLAAVGIRKGEPFAPDAKMAALLMEAAQTGWSEMNVAFFANPRPERLVWKDRNWEFVPLAGPLNPDTNDFGTANYRDLLANDFYFFMAWGTSASIGRRAVGPGSLYFYTPRDSTGAYLDGAKNYKLTVPGPVPAKLFWSVTVYDSETRTIIDTDLGRGAVRTMYENPQPNEEGSFDIYFGPKAPEGKENHWVKTIPGKGWFTFLRIYGPQEPIFDDTWVLPDIERTE